MACNGNSGYWAQIFENGAWKLNRNGAVKLEGVIDGFDSTVSHNVKVEAVYHTVKVYVDGVLVCDYDGDADAVNAMLSAGRAALFSSYNKNTFDNIVISPAEDTDTYITRYDNMDMCFDYSGEWDHSTMDSYKNYKRTFSKATDGASVSFTFNGTGCSITGVAKKTNFSVMLDGAEYDDLVYTSFSNNRECIYTLKDLPAGEHTVTLTVIDGAFAVDGAQVIGEPVETVQQPVHSDAASDAPASTGEAAGTESSQPAGTGENAQDTSEADGGSPVVPIAIGGGAVVVIAAAAAVIIKKKKK